MLRATRVAKDLNIFSELSAPPLSMAINARPRATRIRTIIRMTMYFICVVVKKKTPCGVFIVYLTLAGYIQ